MDTTSPFTSELCTTPEQDQLAFTLRYLAYLDEGFITADAHPDKLFRDKYDHLPNTHNYLLRYQGEPIATLRCCVFEPTRGWNTIPCGEVFPDQLAQLASRHPVLVESCRLAVHPDFQELDPLLPLRLTANSYYTIKQFPGAVLTAIVRKHHLRFYQRMGFKRLTKEYRIPDQLNFPTTLIYKDWQDALSTEQDNQLYLSTLHESLPQVRERDRNEIILGYRE